MLKPAFRAASFGYDPTAGIGALQLGSYAFRRWESRYQVGCNRIGNFVAL